MKCSNWPNKGELRQVRGHFDIRYSSGLILSFCEGMVAGSMLICDSIVVGLILLP